MRIAALFLLAALAMAGDRPWLTGTVSSIDYDPEPPKSVVYEIQGEAGKYVAEDMASTIFHGYRQPLFAKGDPVRFFVKGNRLTVDSGGKQKKLILQRSPTPK
jgi:hypothetical protein